MSQSKFKLYPNQHAIQIHKTPAEHKFVIFNNSTLQNAAQNLSAPAFKLWIYFAQNKNDYIFALSFRDCTERFGLKRYQYQNAFNELISKKYLIKDFIKSKNIQGYIFYDTPLESAKPI